MCKQYLLSEGNISKWKQVKLDNIQDFIPECNSNDDFISEEQSKLLSDYKKTLDYKCDKCGSSMYANMKFGVVEIECETCGCYKDI